MNTDTDERRGHFGPGADQARDQVAQQVADEIARWDRTARRLADPARPVFDDYYDAAQEHGLTETQAMAYATLRAGPAPFCRGCGKLIEPTNRPGPKPKRCLECTAERRRKQDRRRKRTA